MNLVEHHIQKIYSVEDVSKEYEEKTGKKLDEPLLKIDLETDCYGNTERKVTYMRQSKFHEAKQHGYYLG